MQCPACLRPLRRFKTERALVIGVETDLLFPIEQQQELAMGFTELAEGSVWNASPGK